MVLLNKGLRTELNFAADGRPHVLHLCGIVLTRFRFEREFLSGRALEIRGSPRVKMRQGWLTNYSDIVFWCG